MQTTTTRRGLLLFASGLLPLFFRASGSRSTVAGQATASVLSKQMDWMEHDFVAAADAMPEEKFFWVPTLGGFEGVRNFAEQILHVAEVNFALSAAILGEGLPAHTDVSGHNSETMKSRSPVIKYMKDCFIYTHSAVSSITEHNAKLPIKHPLFDMMTTRLGLGIAAIAHPFNHYGQMVEYLRMNNVIPPASRQ